jgi:hypothetical protein
VPVWSTIEIGWFSKAGAATPLWLFEPALYLNAMERVHLEMVFARTEKPVNQYRGLTWGKPIGIGEIAGLPEPTIEWFIDPPEGYAYWSKRFDAHFAACLDSFKYWMRLKCKDSYELTQKLGDAAITGTIEHLTPFPANLIGSVLENLRKSHTKALAAFYKNAYKPIAAPVSADPALDTWLFEAWPLVVQNGWRYPQILALAKRRFSQRTDKPLTRPDQIEARAERLELHFGPGVSKGGAPPATARIQSPFQPIPLLAVFIQGFAELENKWLLGQRGLATSK